MSYLRTFQTKIISNVLVLPIPSVRSVSFDLVISIPLYFYRQ